MSNLKLNYLYRDGSNYKKWGSVTFLNPDNLTCERVEETIRQSFLEEGFFIASQIHLPDVSFYSGGSISLDDHCYHEFHSVEATHDDPSDALKRSIGEFLAEVLRGSQAGWKVFDPCDSKGSYGYLLAVGER